MASTTTTDLIAASRALDPAGRALLNLWLHRGLDDAAIAGLAGGSAADVAERRRQVVERLAAEVGDTPGAIRAALDDLAVRPAHVAAPTSPPPVGAAPRGGPAPGAREAAAHTPAAPPEGLVLPATGAAPGAADSPQAPAEGLVLPGPPAPEAAPEDLVVAGRDVPAAGPVEVAVAHPEDPATPELVVPGEIEPAAAPDDLVVPGREEAPAAASAVVIAPEAERPRAEPPPAPAAPAPPRAVARRSPIPATLGIALGLVIGVTVLAAGLSGGGGGGGEEPRPTPSASPTAAAPRSQPLEALAGGPDRVTGTMAVQGATVRLDVDGLDRPPRDYEVWLYNSLADARPLGRLTDATFRLPPQARDFAFLDVSLEGDRNPNHSGRSVLRARLP